MNANFIICKKLMASENSRRRCLSHMFDANCAQLIQTSTFRQNHGRDKISTLGLAARAHLRRDSPFSSMSSRRKTNNCVFDRIPDRSRDSELIARSNTC